MFEHDYRAKFDEIAPDRALVEDTRHRMRAVLSGEKARPRRLTRRGLVAAAAAAVLTVSALAAGPTLWQAIQNDLGSRTSYATQVEAACEDQGVRIEAAQALADGRMVRVYFTARDLDGNRLDETTQISCSLMRTDRDVWPYCLEGFGPEQLPRLTQVEMLVDYSALSKPVEGEWTIEIPLQTVESEHFSISLALPADLESEGSVMAQSLELSPLSLTLVCDQDTMYLEDGKTLRFITLEKFTPTVFLKDGTVLTPTYADGNSWWATWAFDQPVDPEQVVSITLNGQTIPVDQS